MAAAASSETRQDTVAVYVTVGSRDEGELVRAF